MPGMLTPGSVSLWITSFRRAEPLRATIRGWLDSFPFDIVNVIANDPGMDYHAIGRALGDVVVREVAVDGCSVTTSPQLRIWRNVFRDGQETGAIAWCWNQAMRHTFETRDWCLMSQDDVIITPGWPDLITDQFDTYIAPHGDTVQLQSLAGFNRAGWFDERFRAIGGPEADYLLRVLLADPARASVHDEHGWQMRHNDVGLAGHWRGADKAGEVLETRNTYNVPYAQTECFDRWCAKWGTDVDRLMAHITGELAAGRQALAMREPGWDELDWYPSFTRRLAELGRHLW